MERPSGRAAGRPRDEEKAVAILDAGWALFLDRGIGATSMEAIAGEAGVSKVTLYSHYADKAALFEAAVLREMNRIEQAQRIELGVANEGSFEDRLRHFGIGILTFLTRRPATDFFGVLAGELRRHEALAQKFYDLGPGRTRGNLAALIGVGVRDGVLVPLDPLQAADQLFGLWQGFTIYRLLLKIDIETIGRDIEERVERGNQLFMKVYRA